METRKLRISANEHFKHGNLLQAREAFRNICSLEPSDIHAWHMLGAICGMLKDFHEAATCCEHAISLNPDAPEIQINYAHALLELGRNKDAIKAYQRALELNPDDSGSLNRLGRIYRRLSNESDAEPCFRRAIKVDPKSVEAYCNLAILLSDTGRSEDAISCCKKALTLDPSNQHAFITLLMCCSSSNDTAELLHSLGQGKRAFTNLPKLLFGLSRRLHKHRKYKDVISLISTAETILPGDLRLKLILADSLSKTGLVEEAITSLLSISDSSYSCEAHNLLADLYRDKGDYNKARYHLGEAMHIAPCEVAPVVKLARLAFSAGDRKLAREYLSEFLAKQPDAAEALVELGYTYFLEDNYSLAENYYKQAISRQPEYALGYNNLGTVYQQQARNNAAEKCFLKSLSLDANLFSASCNLAYLYSAKGEYEQAERIYQEVLKKDPSFEQAISGMATVLERRGDLATAYEFIEPIASSGKCDFHSLLAFARLSHKGNRENDAIEQLEAALEHQTLPLADRMQGYFTLGKLLDRMGDYDRAFSFYERGNKLNRSPFDRKNHLKLINAVTVAFSAANMGKYPRASNNSTEPVFIVGMPRSGTTLVEQILSAHHAVFGAGELIHIRSIANSIPNALGSSQPFPVDMTQITEEILDQFSFEHIKTLQSLAGGNTYSIITDKLPANFMFLGIIELLFPKARVIHCTRDPVDTCLSCYFQQFSDGQNFSYDQADIAFFYNTYSKLMKHWKSVLTIPVMDICYDELVNDQERLSKQLVNFVGLDWDPECLRFHKTNRKVLTASYDQVRRPMYTSSAGRWRHYRDHLLPLVQELSMQDTDKP